MALIKQRIGGIALLALLHTTYGAPYSCDELLKSDSTSQYSFPVMEISTFLGKNVNNSKYWEQVKSMELKLNQTGNEITITCWAPFSFEIRYNGHLTNRDASVQDMAVKTGEGTNQQCYTATLRINALIEATGEYSCVGASHGRNSNSSISKYIYVTNAEGKAGVLLARRLENPIVIEPSGRSETLIPCAVSDPEITPELYRANGTGVTESQIKNQRFWLPVETGKGRFDPKMGWIIPTDLCSVGYYKCNITQMKNGGEVFVKVIEGKHTTKGIHNDHDGGKNRSQVESSLGASSIIKNCEKENGTLRSYPCSSIMECDIRRCQRYDSECENYASCESEDRNDCPAAGNILQCLTEGKAPVSIIKAQSVTDGKWQDWSKLSLPGIRVGPTEKAIENCHCYSSGCIVPFTCEVSAMLLVQPISWELVYTNSNGSISEAIPKENISSIVWSQHKGKFRSTAQIFVPPSFNDSKIAVRCCAPLWSPIFDGTNITHAEASWDSDSSPLMIYSEHCQHDKSFTESGFSRLLSLKQLLLSATLLLVLFR